MKKIKRWFFDKFLPRWAKEVVLDELQRAYDLLDQREAEIERLKAYIDGYRTCARNQKKIVIYNGEGKK